MCQPKSSVISMPKAAFSSHPDSETLGMGRTVRSNLKSALNTILKIFSARAVGLDWGPNGNLTTFARAKNDGFSPRTIIDIGASDGRWSESCMSIFPDARYILFDALPDHERALTTFANKHRNVVVQLIALGERPGKLTLNVHGHQSSVLTSRDFKGRPVEVDVRTLDSFVDELKLEGPILLKADVQGFELNILRGAPIVLAMTDLALLEVSYRQVYEGAPLAHEMIATMGDYGYRIYDVCSYDQRPVDGALAQSDIAFARPTSGLFQHEGWF